MPPNGLPNDKQQSALGLTLPPGTGAVWLSVLEDAEALLKGTKLAPYWRQRGGWGEYRQDFQRSAPG